LCTYSIGLISNEVFFDSS